jgi:parvulin-like peptidyl-prolyl isomerase
VKRLVSTVAVAAVVGVAGTACSSSERPTTAPTTTLGADDVASVNGVALKRADFDADMRDYAANTLFLQTAQAGDSNNAVSADFKLKTLQADIIFELVRQEVARRNLTVRSPDDAFVKSQTVGRFDQTGSPDIFNAFTKRFQDRALAQTANLVTLQDALGGGPVDAAHAKATYDADPRRFAEVCVRHVLLDNQADADRVLQELARGADFATVVSEDSKDESSAPLGGKILNADGSCPLATQFNDDAFTKAALGAPLGRPTGPVETKLGWQVILVDTVTVLPFEQVQSSVSLAAEQDVADKAAPQLNKLLNTDADAVISVDPAYGVWDHANHQVLPPGFKPAGPRPAATTTAPATTSA